MKYIVGLFIRMILSLVCVSPVAMSSALAGPAASPTIQSFKEWKSAKVQPVLARVVSLKALAQSTKTVTDKQRVLKLLAQESWNLEITNDLSVNDYFVLYLAPMENAPNRFKEAAARLSRPEMVELMESYSRNLYSGSSDRESGAARSALQADEAILPNK